MNPPQEIVVALLFRWLLEALDVDALWVHRTDHMPACAILAGTVDTLQNNEQTVAAIGVELALQSGDA